MRKLAAVILIIVSCLTLTACGQEGEQPPLDEGSLDEKYADYVEIGNILNLTVIPAFNTYTAAFGEGETPRHVTSTSFTLIFYMPQVDLDKLLTLGEVSERSPGITGIDGAARSFYPHLKAYIEESLAVNAYLVSKDFEKDAFAFLDEEHATLIKLFYDMQSMYEDFARELRALVDERINEQMAAYEAENQMIRYHMTRVLLCADDMQHEILSSDISTDKLLSEGLLDGFRKLLSPLGEAVEGLGQVARVSADIEVSGIGKEDMDSIMLTARQMVQAAEAMVDAADTGREFPYGGSSTTVGSVEHLTALINAFIQKYNGVI